MMFGLDDLTGSGLLETIEEEMDGMNHVESNGEC
jgi:hypothetical protein